MNEAKHTPGPWWFDQQDNSILGEDESLSIATIDRIDVGGEKGFYFGEVSNANVCLITEAPNLLEQLKIAVSRLNDLLEADDGQAHKEARKALPKMESAIAKATGQP